MDLEQDYVEYVVEFSLALLAISSAYFIDPGRPITFGLLALIPLLFGYTAYISRDGFEASSLFSFISLIFAPLGTIMAGAGIVISFGNMFVSVFAGGTRFKDYYRATMIPLLLTGVVLGGATYGYTQFNPEFGEDLRTGIAEKAGEQASLIVDETNLIESQKQTTTQAVQKISNSTVAATQGYVLNQTKENLSGEQQAVVYAAFESARQDVPETVTEASKSSQQQADPIDISGRVSSFVEKLLTGKNILFIAPGIAFGMYALQPVVGLMTAIFAAILYRIGGRENS